MAIVMNDDIITADQAREMTARGSAALLDRAEQMERAQKATADQALASIATDITVAAKQGQSECAVDDWHWASARDLVLAQLRERGFTVTSRGGLDADPLRYYTVSWK